jgi:hypothetical protein
MKKLLVGLLGVLSLGIMFSGSVVSASASEWLCAGQAILTVGNCLGLTTNLEVLLLEDMGEPASAECAVGVVTSEGVLGSTLAGALNVAAATTTAVTFTGKGAEPNCKPAAKAVNLKNEEKANLLEKVTEVTAVGLPWESKIEEEEAGPLWWVLIITKTAGYKIVGKVAGLTVTDTCTAEKATETPLVLAENLPETEESLLLVSLFFVAGLLSEAEAATCKPSIGGENKEDGLVIGENLLTGQIMEAGGTNLAASVEIS